MKAITRRKKVGDPNTLNYESPYLENNWHHSSYDNCVCIHGRCESPHKNNRCFSRDTNSALLHI